LPYYKLGEHFNYHVNPIEQDEINSLLLPSSCSHTPSKQTIITDLLKYNTMQVDPDATKISRFLYLKKYPNIDPI
jgi:hypothetical protein